jgi:hypothetical protein
MLEVRKKAWLLSDKDILKSRIKIVQPFLLSFILVSLFRFRIAYWIVSISELDN